MEYTSDFELTVLSHLLLTEQYGRKILPFLNEQYFDKHCNKQVFTIIEQYVKQYNCFPTKEVLYIELQSSDQLTEQQFHEAKQTIQQLNVDSNTNIEWLIDSTEKFCQERAVYNAIRQSIKIIDDKSHVSKNSIPKLLSDALQVSFDTSIGHDFIDDHEGRFESYHKKDSRLEFDIDYLNKITGGGIPNKTLSCLLAGCVHPNTMVVVRYRKRIAS